MYRIKKLKHSQWLQQQSPQIEDTEDKQSPICMLSEKKKNHTKPLEEGKKKKAQPKFLKRQEF